MDARIGIRELRNNVASVVRRAAAGERIVVTVEGVATAQLGPVGPGPATDLTIDDLVAAGLAQPPARRDDVPPPPPEAEDVPVDVRLDMAIAELRGSR
jgi:prevent-host-death family protein